MITTIKIQNIPENLKHKIHEEYSVTGNFKVNIGECLIVKDHVLNKYRQVGNDINLAFRIKDIKYILKSNYEDYGWGYAKHAIEQKDCIKIVLAELEENTIKIIESLIRTDEHVNSKNIDFGDDISEN